jgi:DNA-binding transcriptional ArsR family regulator
MAPHIWSTPQAASRVRQALRGSDAETPQALLRGLFKDAATMCADGDLTRIARAQGHVARWQSTFTESPDSPVAQQLDLLATTLDAGWRTISLRRDAEAQHAAGTTVRERILAFAQESPGVRPSEIAQGLELDPSQVSRALRTLVESGALVRDVPDGHDQRAVTYAPAAAAAPVAA